MNTVKKISTLFALALISQSSFANELTPETNTETVTEEIAVDIPISEESFKEAFLIEHPESLAYTPTDLHMDAQGNIRSAMQNTLQSASVANDSNLVNNMQFSTLNNSDIRKSMTSSANAMNSNTGSDYNDSTNTIDTTSTDNSTHTYTSTLDHSRNVAPSASVDVAPSASVV